MLSVLHTCYALQELRLHCSLPVHTCFPVLKGSSCGHLTQLCACSFTSILSKLQMRKAISLLAVDEVRAGAFAQGLQRPGACHPASVKSAVP